MIMPRSSPRIISAEGPYRPGWTASCAAAQPHALTAPKSAALHRPPRGRHSTRKARSAVRSIIPLRQPRHFGHSTPSTNAKSPWVGTALSIPRALSLEAFGRRPRRQANMWIAGIRNPSPKRPFLKRQTTVNS
jgi:hypothetical protein